MILMWEWADGLEAGRKIYDIGEGELRFCTVRCLWRYPSLSSSCSVISIVYPVALVGPGADLVRVVRRSPPFTSGVSKVDLASCPTFK